jgi:polysaccharide export outer membrane protein
LVYNLPSQPVGIDDLLAVTVYDSPELSRTVRVGDDGSIRLPMLKQRLNVVGKISTQIEAQIASAFSEEEILVEPVVTVSVAEYKSRPVSVIGAVKSPLTFQALPGTTLIDAITRAQGLTDDAGADILVTRQVTGVDGKVTDISQRIPTKGLIEKTDGAYNLPLSGGEQVRVPEAGKIFVIGNVKRPGAISVHDAVGNTTVLTAIAMSEGLDRFAQNTAYIFRKDSANKEGTPVALSDIMARKAADVPLEPNDILYVPDAKAKRITIESLEKALTFGSTLTAAAIYASTR